ncbi:hypothetical protein GF382_02910 [Candidatus Falkowbacteria bacterium]|nr:hypothetical protein [Candidatus Falkowbacteria bacterium]
MGKKKIYLLIIWIVVLAIAAFIFARFLSFIDQRTDTALKDGTEKSGQELTGEEIVKDDEEEPADDNVKQADDSSIYRNAESKNDPKLCQQITNKELIDGCIANIAANNYNIDACEEISENSERQTCRDMAYFKQAGKSSDTDICKNIKDDYLSKACLVDLIQSRNVRDCSVFSGSQKETCQNHLSYINDIERFKNAKSIKDCEAIDNEAAKAHCLDKF